MNKIEFNLTIKINDKEFTYSLSKDYTDEEMIGGERPQALFQELCNKLKETLLEREYKKKLAKELCQIDYDRRITVPLIKAQQESRSNTVSNSN